MTRGGRGWIGAVAGLTVVCVAAALILMAVSAALTAQAEVYVAGLDVEGTLEMDEFEIYNDLYITADTLTTLAGPLLLCSLAAAFVLLAVLGQRFDSRARLRRAGQTEAPAAS